MPLSLVNYQNYKCIVTVQKLYIQEYIKLFIETTIDTNYYFIGVHTLICEIRVALQTIVVAVKRITEGDQKEMVMTIQSYRTTVKVCIVKVEY